MADRKPLVISAPQPRALDLIFSPRSRAMLAARYRIVECSAEAVASLSDATLAEARYIIGQPPLDDPALAKLLSLRCIFNVETNLVDNMPYNTVFERGIHVVTTGAVFAEPVAEMGIAMALNAARQIVDADIAFREGRERWGLEGNTQARLLSGSCVGIIGFGDLGRALNRLLSGFRTRTRVFDPWLPPSILRDQRVEPAELETVITDSDFVFVVASITTESEGLIGGGHFSRMREGAAFILLSRATIVDFNAMMDAARSGRIHVASDVFPVEPLPTGHPVRLTPNFLRSAHRAGALDVAFKGMGDMVLEDMALLDRGLPPMRCKRAERETVGRMRSKPVIHN